jgi:hypothetical protein
MAVFGECQLVAENLHATEMGFERHHAVRLICDSSLWPTFKTSCRASVAIGRNCVKLQVLLADHLVGKD